MTTFWTMMLDYLMQWVEKTFGKTIANFIRGLLEDQLKDRPDPQFDQLDVSAAPDNVKDAVRKRLKDLIDKALAGHPLILSYMHRILNNLSLSFLDEAWDTIFAVQIRTGLLQKRGEVAVTAEQPKLVKVSDADKKVIEAEVSWSLTAKSNVTG